MKTGIWRCGLMVLAVVLTAAICATALAQQDDLADNKARKTMRPARDGQGDRPEKQRAMMRMMQPPAPVMIVEKPYLYILSGNVLYQIDSETLEQINAVHLMPPPPPEAMRFWGEGQRGGKRRQNNN